MGIQAAPLVKDECLEEDDVDDSFVQCEKSKKRVIHPNLKLSSSSNPDMSSNDDEFSLSSLIELFNALNV